MAAKQNRSRDRDWLAQNKRQIKTKGATKNRQSRNTGNIEYTRYWTKKKKT